MALTPSDELHAKAIIAAALIQAQTVGLTYNESEIRHPWLENEALLRLHKLTQRVYEAISTNLELDTPPIGSR
jgi:hypothetical protein